MRSQAGGNMFECEYCGTMFAVDTDDFGELCDADFSGMNQRSWQVFAVHGTLDVSGMNNVITVLPASAEAAHVRDLDVSGLNNQASVVLLDGARCDVSGLNNRVERA